MVLWSGVDFQCQGVLLIWIIVGQGPPALAVGAGGGVYLVYHFPLFISFSPGDDPILSLSPSLSLFLSHIPIPVLFYTSAEEKMMLFAQNKPHWFIILYGSICRRSCVMYFKQSLYSLWVLFSDVILK